MSVGRWMPRLRKWCRYRSAIKEQLGMLDEQGRILE